MKKKIVIAASQVPFVFGGAELMVDFLKKNLIKRGYDAEVVALPYKWYPEQSLYDSMLAWRMLDVTESNGQKIDLVIATKFPSYAIRHDNKVTWLMHQYRQAYDLYSNDVGLLHQKNGEIIKKRIEAFDNKVIPEAKKLYTISKNVSKRLKEFNDIDSLPLYQPPSLVGRYKAGQFGNYILSVGRLDKLKRNALLIEALKYCDRGIRAKIVGRGGEAEELKKLADSLGVSDRVEFLGFVDDESLLELYSGAFAVFFAPVDEDYGYITLEAFLSKKPVVTCDDSGGVLEFVENGLNGMVTAPNAEELGESINKLYLNKKLGIDMGKLGYNTVKDISWDNVIDKLTETLR